MIADLSGSHLAISHGSDSEEMRRASAVYQEQKVAARPTMRSRAQIEQLFTGLELVAPGVTWIETWHPENYNLVPADTVPTRFLYGAVGRKRR